MSETNNYSPDEAMCMWAVLITLIIVAMVSVLAPRALQEQPARATVSPSPAQRLVIVEIEPPPPETAHQPPEVGGATA